MNETPSAPTRPKKMRIKHTLHGLVFGMNLQTQAVIFRQLATMIEGGLTSARALNSLSKQYGGDVARVMQYMVYRMNEGIPLHQALALYPEYFSEFVVCLVAAGETGGMLDRRLHDVAEYLEQAWAMRQQLVSQAIYPLLVLHAAVFIPPLVELVTHGVDAYLWVTIPRLLIMWAVMITFMLLSRLTSQVGQMRAVFDAFVLTLPIVGKVVRNGSMMRATRAMGDLLDAGVQTGRTITVAANAAGNAFLARKMLDMEPMINRGQRLSTAFAKANILPHIVMQLLMSGEESGTIGQSLNRASGLLKIEYDNALKRMAAVTPAILMLFVAGIVGYQYISFFKGLLATYNQFTP